LTEAIRIDRWLWAARFYKTRGLATEMVNAGHVQLNGIHTKASKIVKIGDQLSISRGPEEFIIHIIALAGKRGSATIAQGLYEEEPTSITARQQLAKQRKMKIALSPAPAKRPDKKARRQIIRFRNIHD
jgi:ribosome-associated heat shock protein Hsp15